MNKFLIKNPIITEKAAAMAGFGKYVFLVDDAANKPEVKKAIESIYKVNVADVHIINTLPKPRRGYGRFPGARAGYKKAVVTLKDGQKLDVLPH